MQLHCVIEKGFSLRERGLFPIASQQCSTRSRISGNWGYISTQQLEKSWRFLVQACVTTRIDYWNAILSFKQARYNHENSSLSTLLDYLKKKNNILLFHLFQNLHLSLYLSLLPLLACTYLNNAWDLVLLALPLYVCLFKINRFMYSPIVSRFG